MSERFACRVLDQHRSTQRKIAKTPVDEAALTADIIAFAIQYGRYGYRRITALLRNAGWVVTLVKPRSPSTWQGTGYVDRVEIACRDETIAMHSRSYDTADFVFNRLHYLALLEHKNKALDQAAPLDNWQLATFCLRR